MDRIFIVEGINNRVKEDLHCFASIVLTSHRGNVQFVCCRVYSFRNIQCSLLCLVLLLPQTAAARSPLVPELLLHDRLIVLVPQRPLARIQTKSPFCPRTCGQFFSCVGASKSQMSSNQRVKRMSALQFLT